MRATLARWLAPAPRLAFETLHPPATRPPPVAATEPPSINPAVIETLRQLDASGSMVTGMDDVQSVERAYSSGATGFIAKPMNWALIGHRVKYLFRGHQALHQLSLAARRSARGAS